MSLVLNIYDFLVQNAAKLRYLFETNSSNEAPTVTTIDTIESRIGFDFFVNVSATLQSSAESSFALCQ